MKLSLFQRYLAKQKIDTTFFVHPDPSITYFTQMEPSHAYFLVTPTNASFYLSALDKKPNLKNIEIKELKKGWEKNLSYNKIKKVGINKQALSVEYLEKAKKLFPKAKFVDVSLKLNELRKEKTSQEIEKMQKACDITSNAFTALVKELSKKTLHTEQDVAFFLEKHIKNHGCELAFPTIVAMGKNAAIPHHKTANVKLHKGFLLFDFGARYENYCADMTRVVFLGSPTSKEKEFYSLLLTAQTNAIGKVVEGISYEELTEVARTTLEKFASKFTHSLGHGIGIEVHEGPLFSDKTQKVEKNVPFTIEPGIYFPSNFGLRIEDTLIFDGKKVRLLTKATKNLITIPLIL